MYLCGLQRLSQSMVLLEGRMWFYYMLWMDMGLSGLLFMVPLDSNQIWDAFQFILPMESVNENIVLYTKGLS